MVLYIAKSRLGLISAKKMKLLETSYFIPKLFETGFVKKKVIIGTYQLKNIRLKAETGELEVQIHFEIRQKNNLIKMKHQQTRRLEKTLQLKKKTNCLINFSL